MLSNVCQQELCDVLLLLMLAGGAIAHIQAEMIDAKLNSCLVD
jgi:hypothetical protein